jgi:hypothetical protein
VTATDTGLGSGSTTFDIVVLAALKHPPGDRRGEAERVPLADRGGQPGADRKVRQQARAEVGVPAGRRPDRRSTASGQRWTAGANGTLAAAGQCLAVTNSSKLHGAAIVLARCGSSSAQKWLRGPDGELMNACSGRCLADPGNSKVSGTRLVQDDCYEQPGEIWVIS